jgi:hypothetical protein
MPRLVPPPLERKGGSRPGEGKPLERRHPLGSIDLYHLVRERN